MKQCHNSLHVEIKCYSNALDSACSWFKGWNYPAVSTTVEVDL